MDQVAKEAGVSPATVSRSFSDDSLMNTATRQRVLEVARRLDYRPPRERQRQRSAQALRTNAHAGKAIGFQFFAPSRSATVQGDAFYAPMLAGAQAEAQESGVHLLLHTTSRHQMSVELPRMVTEQAVAGLLLVGTADREILTAFLEHVPQIVLVDNRDATGRHDCVLSDGVRGALTATRYLLELGHRRIAFVQSDPETETFQDRLMGYLSAHYMASVPVDPSLIASAKKREELPALLQALLTRSDRPTALMAANDPHAYLAMQVSWNLGVSVPGDLSVVGFDDDKFSPLSYPPLTTVHVDTEYIGRLAIRRLQARLLESMTRSAPDPPLTIEVPVSLVVRGSCGPPRF